MASYYQGFTIFQPVIGGLLEFTPAMGTMELDQLIDSYIVGQMPIQEKRARVTIDFYDWSRLTGQTFKYYPVVVSPSTSFIDSPTGSATFDSGYGSSIEPSPVLTSWESPASSLSTTRASASSMTPPALLHRLEPPFSPSDRPKRCAPPSRSNTRPVDFHDMPGMRILTRDGRDVTNSTSRACKTKEQRDHTHMMRILKACDDCRRKKSRCDPSHRNRPQTNTFATESRSATALLKSLERRPTSRTEQPPQSASSLTLVPGSQLPVSSVGELAIPQLDLASSIFTDDFFNAMDLFPDLFADQDTLGVIMGGFNTPTLSHSSQQLQSPQQLQLLQQMQSTPGPHSSAPFVTGLPTSGPATLAARTSAEPSLGPSALPGNSHAAVDSAVVTPALPFMQDVPGADYTDFSLYSPASDTLDDDFDFQVIGARESISPIDPTLEREGPRSPQALTAPQSTARHITHRHDSSRSWVSNPNIDVGTNIDNAVEPSTHAVYHGREVIRDVVLSLTPDGILPNGQTRRLQSSPQLLGSEAVCSQRKPPTHGQNQERPRLVDALPSQPISSDNEGCTSRLASTVVQDSAPAVQDGFRPHVNPENAILNNTTGHNSNAHILPCYRDGAVAEWVGASANGRMEGGGINHKPPHKHVGNDRHLLDVPASPHPQVVRSSQGVSRSSSHLALSCDTRRRTERPECGRTVKPVPSENHQAHSEEARQRPKREDRHQSASPYRVEGSTLTETYATGRPRATTSLLVPRLQKTVTSQHVSVVLDQFVASISQCLQWLLGVIAMVLTHDLTALAHVIAMGYCGEMLHPKDIPYAKSSPSQAPTSERQPRRFSLPRLAPMAFPLCIGVSCT